MVGIAVVTIIARKKTQTRKGLWGLLHYCMQDKKTIHNGRKLVTGINCVAQSAFNEMVNTKLQYRKSGGRQYYHIMQSFHPDEPITPETAHEIALRFAEENFPGYEVLVATHVDRHHVHSHFVVNSVNAETGLKFHSDNHEIQRLRDASDRLCVEYGFSVVVPKSKTVKGMSTAEYHVAEKGQSWKLDLAMAIDEAMRYAVSKEHFIELMEMEGYERIWKMNSESEKKSLPELKAQAQRNLDVAKQTTSFVSVPERSWTALIQLQQNQIKMLGSIAESLKTLATWSDLSDMQEEQLAQLTAHAEQTEQTLTAFQEMLQAQAEQIQTVTSTSMETFQSQVGKASESFSQQLSTVEQTVKRSLKKLILVSLIPTILLIIWELIRHIWLRT